MLKISKQALSCPGPRCARSAGGIRCRIDPGIQKWLFISKGGFSGTGGAQHAGHVAAQQDHVPYRHPSF